MLAVGTSFVLEIPGEDRVVSYVVAHEDRVVRIVTTAPVELVPGRRVRLAIPRPGEAPYLIDATVGQVAGLEIDAELVDDLESAFARRFLRIEDPVKVFVIRRGDDGRVISTQSTESRDISAGGLGLGNDIDVELHEVIQVRISLAVPVLVRARVVRLDRSGVGLKFELMSDADEQRIVQHVNGVQTKKRVEAAA
jgi:hypothetical protein